MHVINNLFMQLCIYCASCVYRIDATINDVIDNCLCCNILDVLCNCIYLCIYYVIHSNTYVFDLFVSLFI